MQDQLRYQQMSSIFIAFRLPSLPKLALDTQDLAFLMYLRSVQGVDVLPSDRSLPSYPAAWFQPARQLAKPLWSSFNLALDISVSKLSEHLKAASLLRGGGAAAPVIRSACVEFRGVSWAMTLQSFSQKQTLHLGLEHTLLAGAGVAALKAGVYARITFRLDSASPIISATTSPIWIGSGGGYDNFVQQFGKRQGDASDINWWTDYIVDGRVCFSATVELL